MPRPPGPSAGTAPCSRGGAGQAAEKASSKPSKLSFTEQKPGVTEGAAENTDGDRGWRVRLEEQRPSACEEAREEIAYSWERRDHEKAPPRGAGTRTEVQSQQQRGPLPPSWCPSRAQARVESVQSQLSSPGAGLLRNPITRRLREVLCRPTLMAALPSLRSPSWVSSWPAALVLPPRCCVNH